MSERTPLTAWGDDVPLRGEGTPQNDGSIRHLIEYLLTVYERFGNTTVTASLQWGASALWKRDELAEQLAQVIEGKGTDEAAPDDYSEIGKRNWRIGQLLGKVEKLEAQLAKVAQPEAASPNDGGITQALVAMARENAIEECARAVEDAGGDNEHYHAEAVRALKSKEER